MCSIYCCCHPSHHFGCTFHIYWNWVRVSPPHKREHFLMKTNFYTDKEEMPFPKCSLFYSNQTAKQDTTFCMHICTRKCYRITFHMTCHKLWHKGEKLENNFPDRFIHIRTVLHWLTARCKINCISMSWCWYQDMCQLIYDSDKIDYFLHLFYSCINSNNNELHAYDQHGIGEIMEGKWLSI